MTISELFVGAMRADSDARRSQRTAYVEDVISKLAVLPFTAVTARLHAGLHADLPTRGQLIGAHDLIIAATALEHGHSVLTTNRREFDRVDGLDVIDFPFPA